MIEISKEEAAVIRKLCPRTSLYRTVRKYYMEEGVTAMRVIDEMRNGNVIEDHAPKKKGARRW